MRAKSHTEKRCEADKSQFKTSCEVDKFRPKPVIRLKKPKRALIRGRGIQSGTIREVDKTKLKQGERQMKPIRDKT